VTNPTPLPDLNEVRITGAVAFDPDVVEQPNGHLRVSFKVNTLRAWRVEGQRREALDTHKVFAWNDLAKTAGELKRSDRVSVFGRLQSRSLADPETGVRQSKVEIVAETIIRHHDTVQ
jgi:single-stranded DNA-binding protein